MANETISSVLAGIIPVEVCSKELGEALVANVGVRDFVWTEYEDVSKTIKFGFLPALTAGTFAEDTGMPFTQFSPTSVSVTAVPIGLTVRVSELASHLSPRTVLDVIQAEGHAIAVKVDTDLCSLFSGFTASVGTSGAATTTAIWLAAIGKLNVLKVPLNDRAGVLGPIQYSDLLGGTQTTNVSAFAGAAQSGVLPPIYGVTPVMSQTLATANSGVDNVGAMFQRRAIGLGMVKDVSTVVQASPAQYKSTDIASTIYYGVGLLDQRGVKIVSKLA